MSTSDDFLRKQLIGAVGDATLNKGGDTTVLDVVKEVINSEGVEDDRSFYERVARMEGFPEEPSDVSQVQETLDAIAELWAEHSDMNTLEFFNHVTSEQWDMSDEELAERCRNMLDNL